MPAGPSDDLGLASDAGDSRELLAELFWGDPSYPDPEEALNPAHYKGTRAEVLELIRATADQGLYLALQFQKKSGGSCRGDDVLMSPTELTRVANFMSHLSMAFPNVKAWFIDDFMAHFCDPWG